VSRINLLPDHFIARQRRQRAIVRFAIAGAFTVLAATAWGAIAHHQLGELSKQVAQAQTKLADEQQRTRTIELKAAEARSLRAMLAHRGQLEPPVASAGVLTLLTHLLPDSVALTRLTVDVPTPDMVFRAPLAGSGASAGPPAPSPQPTRVMLEGLALSDVELTQVVSALAGQKAFTNVKLVRSRQVPLGNVARFGFEISLDVPPAATAPAGEKAQRGA
jgi:Tfp pilus assembly protein PilN